MKLNITVDGQTYEVDVEASEPEPVRPAYASAVPQVRAAAAPVLAAASAPATGHVADEAKVCRSPVSGMVVKVNSKSGDAAQAGDVLLVLEAMKMETNITAPAAASVAKVNVGVGDAVKKGQVLVEFD